MISDTQSKTNSISDRFSTIELVYTRYARRLIPSVTVIVAWLILRSLRNRSASSLLNEGFVTGYSLAAICVLLLLLGLRKRIVSVQIGRMVIWQQTHHYLGLLSVGAYALHAGLFTTGWLESMLAFSFWSIALSGLVGWYVNRTAPKMLRAAGSQILRQDIPEKSRLIAKQAHALALVSAGKSDTAALADHYRRHLGSYFSKRRGLIFRISPTGVTRRRLHSGLENIDRYLSDEGRLQRREMSLLVQAKDDLDFQSAIQNRIRLWVSAHTWLLGGFLVLTVAHVIAAHQFTSSW